MMMEFADGMNSEPALGSLEREVVEAALIYFTAQRAWTERGIISDFAEHYDKLWGSVEALLAARAAQPEGDPQ